MQVILIILTVIYNKLNVESLTDVALVRDRDHRFNMATIYLVVVLAIFSRSLAVKYQDKEKVT